MLFLLLLARFDLLLHTHTHLDAAHPQLNTHRRTGRRALDIYFFLSLFLLFFVCFCVLRFLFCFSFGFPRFVLNFPRKTRAPLSCSLRIVSNFPAHTFLAAENTGHGRHGCNHKSLHFHANTTSLAFYLCSLHFPRCLLIELNLLLSIRKIYEIRNTIIRSLIVVAVRRVVCLRLLFARFRRRVVVDGLFSFLPRLCLHIFCEFSEGKTIRGSTARKEKQNATTKPLILLSFALPTSLAANS